MTEIRLNKELWIEINRLKSLTEPDAPVRYLLTKSPFNDDDEDADEGAAATLKEIIITGQIFPNSEIFKQGSYEIEMKLTPTYRFEPPEVRFLTPIYHPNVAKDGKFCCELLKTIPKWAYHPNLVNVIRTVVKYIDNPNLDYIFSFEIGREYVENKSVFDQKALEYIRKYALRPF